MPQEIVFPSRGGWKQKFLPFRRSIESEQTETTDGQTQNFQLQRMIATSADDMMKLWGDSSVQSLLKSAEIRLDEQPGLCVSSKSRPYFPALIIDSFLDQISRIAKENYIPRPGELAQSGHVIGRTH